MNIEAISTSFADFLIAHEYNRLSSIDICHIKEGKLSPFAKEVKNQLNEYFSGKRKVFDLDFCLNLTPFAARVTDELLKVPYGEVISYMELAKRAGSPKAGRAVGNVMSANPLPIIIPCHRVIAANGLGGYSYGAEMKIKLLELEGIDISKFKH